MARPKGKQRFKWTEKRMTFVLKWKGDDVAAAREAGFADPSMEAYRIMQHPEVRAAIEEKKSGLIKQSAEQISKETMIGPGDIINGLAEIGKDKKENGAARVRAWDSLAEIYGMKTKFSADLTEQITKGKSKEELIYAGIHGFWAETREVAEAFVRGIPPALSN